jgi:hypothetical protein
MSMNAEPENFDQLRRLLKLKRHESPPPRYYNDFSSQVILRLRTGLSGGRAELVEAAISESPWVRRFWQAIENRPAVSGLLTAGACALLVVGVLASDNARPTLNFTAEGMAGIIELPETNQSESNSFDAARPGSAGVLFANSTNPAAQLPPGRSLFGEFPSLGAPQRVNGMPMVPR